MNYGFELMSEIIPLCIVAVLGIDMKKGGEKDFLPSIIILSIIEIPALIVTLFCMFIKIPQSNSRVGMRGCTRSFVVIKRIPC